MDLTIAAFLAQDGLITGAIYALMAVAIVLVFTVTPSSSCRRGTSSPSRH